MMNKQDKNAGCKRFDMVEQIADPDRNKRTRVFEQIHRHRNKIWGNTLVKLLHKYPSSEIPTFISYFLNTTDCLSTITECQRDKGRPVSSALSIDTAIMMFTNEAGRRFVK